ncbi:MAG TPA: xanthine dehydrogenase family protein molybdopterin-binding subunit [Chloroflexota bacterium]|nr:xanthine dehydrogenase family protein molybdopterin-binding subunit [Chloroflexota bacterium]
MAVTQPRLLGTPIKRREDPKLITGGATYVDDLHLVGTTYMAVLRSPYAHARVNGIDTTAAKAAPGVVAVVTAADVNDATVGPLPVLIPMSAFQDGKSPERRVLAMDKVRYVGDPLAAVVAESREAARDALALVEVDFEPLEAVVDPEQAILEGAPVLHEQFGTNVAHRQHRETGEVDSIFANAERVVKTRVVNQRLLPAAMEPRGCVADFKSVIKGAGQLTLWDSTQVPHSLRTQMAKTLGLPEHSVRVIAPEVGGGFGNKIDLSPEETLACIMSMRLERPVKWIEERRENLQAAMHGRGQVQEAEAAVAPDGRVQAMKVRIVFDCGAYYQYITPLFGMGSGMMLAGNYDIPNHSFDLVGAFTNKTPIGAYRGAGRPEAIYLMECLMDRIAHDLGLDPAEVRRVNFIKPEDFPYQAPGTRVFDTGNYEGALNKALEVAKYAELRAEQKTARAEGRIMGIGVAAYVEVCGFGPWESGTVRVENNGLVTALTGTSPHGQGLETAFSQLIADELTIPMDQIEVLHGDTAIVPTGIGTMGSRSAVVGGSALFKASVDVREKMVQIAANLMEASIDDVELANGTFSVRGAPDKSIAWGRVVAAAYGGKIPEGMEYGLTSTHHYAPEGETFPFGVHISVVDIDPDTGRVTLRRHIAIDDCGPILNPLLAEGQRHGGIAQGAGQALFEGVIYDEMGQLVTGSFMDYAMPTAHNLPSFEMDRTETPTTRNPLGIKGIGEAATIGSTPAIRNAVLDALRPFGADEIDMPTSDERVWHVIHNGK